VVSVCHGSPLNVDNSEVNDRAAGDEHAINFNFCRGRCRSDSYKHSWIHFNWRGRLGVRRRIFFTDHLKIARRRSRRACLRRWQRSILVVRNGQECGLHHLASSVNGERLAGGCIFHPVVFSPLAMFDGVEGEDGKTATPPTTPDLDPGAGARARAGF
jgi:hypothetical protein